MAVAQTSSLSIPWFCNVLQHKQHIILEVFTRPAVFISARITSLSVDIRPSQFQDLSTRGAYLQEGTLCPGRRRPTAPTAAVCIYLMYSVTEREDVNKTLRSFFGSQFRTVCHQLCETAVCCWGVQMEAKDVFLRSWTTTNTIRRWWDVLCAIFKCSDLFTYLPTYIHISFFLIFGYK